MNTTQRIVATFLLACTTLLSGCLSTDQSTDQPTQQASQQPNSQPLVISTIKPIHALAVAVAGEHIETKQLLPDGTSPHRYALKPSDIQALQQAAVIIRIDSTFETFLNKAFENIDQQSTDQNTGKTHVLNIADLKGIQHLSVRGHHDHGHNHGSHEHHGHDDYEADNNEDKHDRNNDDMHVWLNPDNMITIAEHIADTLSQIDPDNGADYQQNAATLRAKLQETDTKLQAQLASVRQQPFMVFHDAWQHFEKHYDLNFAGAITLDASRQPGARHVQHMKEQLEQQQAVCLFREPQFSPALLNMLARETQVRTAVIDPLGTAIPINDDFAVKLLQETADRFVECLSED